MDSPILSQSRGTEEPEPKAELLHFLLQKDGEFRLKFKQIVGVARSQDEWLGGWENGSVGMTANWRRDGFIAGSRVLWINREISG